MRDIMGAEIVFLLTVKFERPFSQTTRSCPGSEGFGLHPQIHFNIVAYLPKARIVEPEAPVAE
jgi:hypothetical protein